MIVQVYEGPAEPIGAIVDEEYDNLGPVIMQRPKPKRYDKRTR